VFISSTWSVRSRPGKTTAVITSALSLESKIGFCLSSLRSKGELMERNKKAARNKSAAFRVAAPIIQSCSTTSPFNGLFICKQVK